MSKIALGILNFVVIVLLSGISAFLVAIDLSYLWFWFVCSYFPNIPTIGIVQAYGIILIAGLLLHPVLKSSTSISNNVQKILDKAKAAGHDLDKFETSFTMKAYTSIIESMSYALIIFVVGWSLHSLIH